MSFLVAPQCPKGHGEMILRTSQSVNNPGRMYYICPLELKHEGFFVWWDVYQKSCGRSYAGDSNSANCSTADTKTHGARRNVGDENMSSTFPYPPGLRTDQLRGTTTSELGGWVNQNWEMDRGRFLVPAVHVYVFSYVVVLLLGLLLGVLIARAI